MVAGAMSSGKRVTDGGSDVRMRPSACTMVREESQMRYEVCGELLSSDDIRKRGG